MAKTIEISQAYTFDGTTYRREMPREVAEKYEVGGVSSDDASGLPEDFPGRSALEGYDSVAEVEDASDEELLSVDGIGESTLEDIRAYEGE